MKDQNRIIKQTESAKEDETNLIALVKTLWEGRRTIIKTLIIFTVLGLFIAILSKKEYEAYTVMVPQIENPSSNLGGLSSLASLAGFDMNMNAGTEAISPILYPEIISSVSFQLEIMNAEYTFDELEEPTSLLDYYSNIYKPGVFGTLKKFTIGLPGLIKSAKQRAQPEKESDSKSDIIRLTLEQDEVRKIIGKNISLVLNDNNGQLTLAARFHQAYLSAQVAQKCKELLQEYVTQFKIEKAAAQLEFIRERYEENKKEFEEAQSKLAAFRDANKNITSEIMRTHEEQLQNEYQLAFEVYSELAKQLEQSMIKVKEDTPLFSVIEEVIVPIEKSKPNRKLILIVWIFLGVILGIGIVFSRIIGARVKEQWEGYGSQ